MSAKNPLLEISPFATDRMASPSIPAGLPKTAMDHIMNVRDNAIAADMELSGNQADVIAETDAALTNLLATWEAEEIEAAKLTLGDLQSNLL